MFFIDLFGGGFCLDDDLGNLNFEFEIKIEWEIGIDLCFFRDCLGFFIIYYSNEIEGIFLNIFLMFFFGFDI